MFTLSPLLVICHIFSTFPETWWIWLEVFFWGAKDLVRCCSISMCLHPCLAFRSLHNNNYFMQFECKSKQQLQLIQKKQKQLQYWLLDQIFTTIYCHKIELDLYTVSSICVIKFISKNKVCNKTFLMTRKKIS